MNERSSNSVLRDFIYIDKDRLYSLYSQLFKGVAESMVEAFSSGKEDSESQKEYENTKKEVMAELKKGAKSH